MGSRVGQKTPNSVLAPQQKGQKPMRCHSHTSLLYGTAALPEMRPSIDFELVRTDQCSPHCPQRVRATPRRRLERIVERYCGGMAGLRPIVFFLGAIATTLFALGFLSIAS